ESIRPHRSSRRRPWPCPPPKRARQAKGPSRSARERRVAPPPPRARLFAERGRKTEPQAPRCVQPEPEPAPEPELAVETEGAQRLAQPSIVAAPQEGKASARVVERAVRAWRRAPALAQVCRRRRAAPTSSPSGHGGWSQQSG